MIDKKLIKKLPPSPGVYLFKDETGNILYVGKALNIRKRVKNYLDKTHKDERINYLLNKSEIIDYINVNSELEALLLEAKLIKQYQPKFNVRLKDDKRYLYAGISKEIFPRVFLLRKPEKEEDLLYWFGPFPSSLAIKEILRLLRRIFPYRSCRKMPKRVCLYYHLHLCPGMCQFKIEKKDYSKTIQKIKLFLEGKIPFLVKNLEKEMKMMAQELKFEEAKRIYQEIQKIERLIIKFKRTPQEEQVEEGLRELRRILAKYEKIDPFIISRLEAYDVANLGKRIVVGSLVVFINGEPAPNEYRHFKIKNSEGGDPQAIREMIYRRLGHKEWFYPQLILIDGGRPQISAAFSVLKEKELENHIGILGLAKREEKLIVPLIENGKIGGWKEIRYSSKSPLFPIIQHARDEAHRFAQRYYRKLHHKLTFSFGRE